MTMRTHIALAAFALVAAVPAAAPAAAAAAPVAEEAAPVPAVRPIKRATSRPLARRTPALGAPAKAHPAKVTKVAKGWVDPFAE